MKSEGWFLYEGAREGLPDAGLVRETFELPPLERHEVIAEPLYGSWEGNMGHAVARSPIDICKYRREPRVLLGNCGVVRVLEPGPDVTTLKAGDIAMVFGASEPDAHGYPRKAYGYDMPGTMGCLATRITIPEANLIALPSVAPADLPRWAAFSGRYVTGWSNFTLALKVYRLTVPESEDPAPNVWGWGGGTALAELDLARRFGCRAVMIGGSDQRLEKIRRSGVTPLDRREFGNLTFDEDRVRSDLAYRRSYSAAEARFARAVEELTQGRRVQIFIDHIGGPVFRATKLALSRHGIIATAGWKQGMKLDYLRAVACIERHQFIHTHYCSRREALEAKQYAEANDWLPEVDAPIHSFDDIPALARAHAEGATGQFPIYRVNAIT